TNRKRPNNEQLHNLVALIHSNGKLAMADCDSRESIQYAVQIGCDLISTTLSGYTTNSPTQQGPDLELIAWASQNTTIPILAEGRFTEPWQVQAALLKGAKGVVIGGAINDPLKQTKRFI